MTGAYHPYSSEKRPNKSMSLNVYDITALAKGGRPCFLVNSQSAENIHR